MFNITFSTDDHLLASCSEDGTIKLWDLTTWQVIGELKPSNAEWELFFHADNTRLASDAGTVWDIASSETEHALSSYRRVTFSPDGAWMAVAGIDSPIEFWSVDSWQIERETLASHGGGVFALAFSPDSKRLASASIDSTVKVWDLQTRKLQYSLNNVGGLWDVTFSPDGRLLASAGDSTVRLWDLASGRLVHTLGHGDEVKSKPLR